MNKNSKYLKPPTPQEARERGKKGGIKSGETRRKKRVMKEAAEILLSSKAPESSEKILKCLGIKENDMTLQMGILAKVALEAIDGNIKAAEFFRELMEDKKQSSIDITNVNKNNNSSLVQIYLPDNGRTKKD